MTTWKNIETCVRVIHIIKPTHEQTRQVRSAFTIDIKRAFKTYAKIAHRNRHNMFEVHHKIPISFGGHNGFENLQLCEKGIHGFFHQFIEEQNPKMMAGCVYPVRLPMPAGWVVYNRDFGL